MFQWDRITFTPRIMAGQACIRGMRIPVSLVVNLVAHGKPTTEILAEYPDLEPEDIEQALKYVAWLAREQVYPIQETKKDLFHPEAQRHREERFLNFLL